MRRQSIIQFFRRKYAEQLMPIDRLRLLFHEGLLTRNGNRELEGMGGLYGSQRLENPIKRKEGKLERKERRWTFEA